MKDLKTNALARATADGIELAIAPFDGDRFRIDWGRINHKGKLLRWIRRLCDKGWFSPAMCGDLIDTAAERFGWTIEGLPQ